MNVRKRNGCLEPVSFDKILQRVQGLCHGLDAVDVVRVCKRVVQGVHEGVHTSTLDDLTAETAAALASRHPDYALLAGRVAVSNLHKKTSPSIRSVLPFLDNDVVEFALEFQTEIDAALKSATARDMNYDFFGFRTLERSYLLRDSTGSIVERPQTLLMRVSIGIHCGVIQDALETFDLMSRGAFTHATPTMFNAGTPFPHLASCFLLPISEDSIEGIYETQKRCAIISKSAGGVGFSLSNVRAAGSRVASTGGISGGIVPMLRCFEATARHVDQGGGKRKGAFAAYLEPWHADVEAFLNLKKNHGAEELRARDLFYALWVPDLFMRRVEAGETWSLFCPADCPDLVDLHGVVFDARYEEYERAGVARKSMRAQDLWMAIIDAQIETGTPFLLYKDACNAKSNQKHLGTIRSSNLCTEIVQFSSADEIAVCNLASLSLPFFVNAESGTLDFSLLERVVDVVTRNLNRVIDRNRYAREEAHRSNLRHRPIGLGVQGLADVFAILQMPFDSREARALNRDIFEAIYLAAVRASCDLARVGGAYETFPGSPASEGALQFDLWGVEPQRPEWSNVRADVAAYGLRNSLLVAPMPTASTAQILGNNECFEPFTSNLYVRRVLAGEFIVVNKHLVRALERHGLWTEEVRIAIVAGNGSVQNVPQLPDELKSVFRTAWELSMRTLLDMAADRGPYIDQSQSLNLFVAQPTHGKLSSMHFYGWKKGLKTGMYYLRTRPATDAVKVTVPVECMSCSA